MKSGTQGSRLPFGEDPVAGHVHARPLSDTPGYDVIPRVKKRLRSKTSLAEIERQERGRSRIPEMPRLRVLNQDPADVPIPEGSLLPADSPASGQHRAHPYTPVGNTVGSSSFEVVPSVVGRAASERGLSESMETIPIPRSSSSQSIIQNSPQVMSANLVAGSASYASPSGSGVEADAGVQAILQQWQEVKTEHGTVERTFTQCAQAWPLASNVKLEGMESAILVLRQACDYLHDGQAALEARFTRIEETLQKSQQKYSQWQENSVMDFQSVEACLTQVHTMVADAFHRPDAASSSMSTRPRETRLSMAARKGDTRVEVDSPEACRVGEVVLLGEQEAKMVIDKGSLVFRFPLERLSGRSGCPSIG